GDDDALRTPLAGGRGGPHDGRHASFPIRLPPMGFLDIAILLNITVGPTKAAAMYLALTAEADPKLKRQIAVRTVVTATAILLLFALAGQLVIFGLQVPKVIPGTPG
ncbi:MAG TPA: MarC family protein, partial [Geminicoccaceae bacterium]|nr:MarC family protein [Geminicoccaceae bacterium]